MAICFLPTVHTFTLVSTSLQRPFSSVPKVAVVERFNCTFAATFPSLETKGETGDKIHPAIDSGIATGDILVS